MRRRDALRGAGVLLGLVLAGCSGDGGSTGDDPGGPPAPPSNTTADDGVEFTTTSPTPDPAPNLTIATFGSRAAEDGSLVIPVTVENVASQQSSAVLLVTVTLDGETYEREKRVTVDADASTTYDFGFEPTYEAYQAANSRGLDFTWRDDEG